MGFRGELTPDCSYESSSSLGTFVSVRSKLKCPLFIASEMSGSIFGFIHNPVVVAAVGKWESRVLGGISKRGGKAGFGAFPRSVFSTAFGAAFLLVRLEEHT